MIVYFVDPGPASEMSRVLCLEHRTALYPKAFAIEVTRQEHQQAVLNLGHVLKCEECTGMTL